MKFIEILESKSSLTPFTCLQAVENIIGKDKISNDAKTVGPNQFLISSVDMSDKEDAVSSKVKQDNPNLFRGRGVKPKHFASFSGRTDAQNLPDPIFKGHDWYEPPRPYLGDIVVPDINSKNADDIASAVHEAYHAWIFARSKQGKVYANEKMVNQQAEKWLRKHLSGMALHVAIESITDSRIGYGHNK